MDISVKNDLIAFKAISDLIEEHNLFVFCGDENLMQWTATNLFQSECKESEKGVLYGGLISNRSELNYQLSFVFPWGYKINDNYHATLDALRNKNTMPRKRFLYWYDADFLAKADIKTFQSFIKDLLFVSYESYKVGEKKCQFRSITFFNSLDFSCLDFIEKESFKDYPILDIEAFRKKMLYKVVTLTK